MTLMTIVGFEIDLYWVPSNFYNFC